MADSKILVVDDNAAVRHGLISLINSVPGFSVCGDAGDGQQCLAQVEKLKPDLVILDISMPIMNGLEAAKQLRQTNPLLPIIFCSSFEGLPLKNEAADLGAVGVFSKSQPVELLFSCMKSALARDLG